MACLEGLPNENLFSQKGIWQHGLGLHLIQPQDFWNNVILTDKTKIEMSVHNEQHHFWRKPNTNTILIPTVKRGRGGDGLSLFSSHNTWPPHIHIQKRKNTRVLKLTTHWFPF